MIANRQNPANREERLDTTSACARHLYFSTDLPRPEITVASKNSVQVFPGSYGNFAAQLIGFGAAPVQLTHGHIWAMLDH